MKATGIVRRIDDLGRVVVPKEIRRTLRIREGDPMEIFTNRDGEVILKKYSPIGEIDAFAKQYAESLAAVSGCYVVISDRDQVIAVSGGVKKEYIGRRISHELEEIMEQRRTVNTDTDNVKTITIIDGQDVSDMGQIIFPIICEGDVIGSVIVLAKDKNIGSVVLMSKTEKQQVSDTEKKLVSVAADFLGRQMES